MVERGGDEYDWLGEVEVELAAGGGREGQLGRRLLENRNLHEVHPATRHAPSHQHVNPRFALLKTQNLTELYRGFIIRQFLLEFFLDF